MIASAAPAPSAARTTAPVIPAKRYLALDAYRGLIMLALVSGGFGFGALAGRPWYGTIAGWLDHAAWDSPVFWDMIQPAFLFMVGVAMPFALARRMEEGYGFKRLFGHVSVRALRLLLASEVIMCIERGRINLQFTNVLAQIAFTYFFCFLLMRLKFRWQVVAALAILAGYTALWAIFPGPDGPFSKTGNLGAVTEYALLNYVNRGFYAVNPGHYSAINFIPSIVTSLFGVWTGMLLQSRRTDKQRLRIMAAAAMACFGGAWLLSLAGIPIVKRLWTASWTLYSAAWALLMMLTLYWVIEVRGFRRWTFPLAVVGTNSIFIYFVDEVLRGWINKSLAVFTGGFKFLGTTAPIVQSCAVLLVMWYLCYWLYKRKIFFKL
jgi:predicted acyltransferase